jgi:hypothetical protein
MEQYFKAVHADEEEKVTISSMYLTGDAKLCDDRLTRMGIGLRSGQRPVSGLGPGEGIPNTVVSSSLVIDRALGLSL